MDYKPTVAICPHGHEDTFILYFSADYTSFSYICEHCSMEQKKTDLKLKNKDALTKHVSVNKITCKCPKEHESDENCLVLIQEIPDLEITEVFYFCNKCNLEYSIEILPEFIGLQ